MRIIEELRELAKEMNKSLEVLLYEMLNDVISENQKYKEAIDKAIKFIEDEYYSLNTIDINSITLTSNKLLQVRNILKEVE